MLHFKSCPRCRGDVNVDRDWYGEYKNCLQCGWSQDTSSDPLSTLAQTINMTNREAVMKQAG